MPSLEALLDAVKVIDYALSMGKVAVHCHAGLGRTGVLIACHLVYSLRCTGNKAIAEVRRKRLVVVLNILHSPTHNIHLRTTHTHTHTHSTHSTHPSTDNTHTAHMHPLTHMHNTHTHMHLLTHMHNTHTHAQHTHPLTTHTPTQSHNTLIH